MPERTQADEVPWFPEPPDAALVWQQEWEAPEGGPLDLGTLWFVGPDGKRAAIQVTHGPTTRLTFDGVAGSHVWHIEELNSGAQLRVSPSVHFIGYWHSPNPVLFNQVPELPPMADLD